MWNRKSKHTTSDNTVGDAVARTLAAWIIRMRIKIVALLQGLESRCTHRQKKIGLLLFCGLFGGYCLFLIIHAFAGKSPVSTGIITRHNKGSPPLLPPQRADTTSK